MSRFWFEFVCSRKISAGLNQPSGFSRNICTRRRFVYMSVNLRSKNSDCGRWKYEKEAHEVFMKTADSPHTAGIHSQTQPC